VESVLAQAKWLKPTKPRSIDRKTYDARTRRTGNWLSFSPDGKSLALLIQDEYAVRFWRLERLQQRLGEFGLGW